MFENLQSSMSLDMGSNMNRKALREAGYYDKVAGECDILKNPSKNTKVPRRNTHNVPNKRRNAAKSKKYAEMPVSGYATKHVAAVHGAYPFTPKMEWQMKRSFRLYDHLTREERREALLRGEFLDLIDDALLEVAELKNNNNSLSSLFEEEKAYWAGYASGLDAYLYGEDVKIPINIMVNKVLRNIYDHGFQDGWNDA